MAKKNNYWGLVAVGALTAAAAGAVASIILKKSHRGYAAFEDDFEDDYFEDDFLRLENSGLFRSICPVGRAGKYGGRGFRKGRGFPSDPVKEEPAAKEDEKDSAPDTEKGHPQSITYYSS